MNSRRTLRFLIALIALTGFFTTLLAARAAAPKPAAGNQQQIDRFLRKHESLKLEPLAAARHVRESGRLLLTTADRSFDIELTPNELRAANYRAEEVVDGGAMRSVATVTGNDKAMRVVHLRSRERHRPAYQGQQWPGSLLSHCRS